MYARLKVFCTKPSSISYALFTFSAGSRSLPCSIKCKLKDPCPTSRQKLMARYAADGYRLIKDRKTADVPSPLQLHCNHPIKCITTRSEEPNTSHPSCYPHGSPRRAATIEAWIPFLLLNKPSSAHNHLSNNPNETKQINPKVKKVTHRSSKILSTASSTILLRIHSSAASHSSLFMTLLFTTLFALESAFRARARRCLSGVRVAIFWACRDRGLVVFEESGLGLALDGCGDLDLDLALAARGEVAGKPAVSAVSSSSSKSVKSRS